MFHDNHKIAKLIPSFLHGVVDEEGGWQAYIGDTINRFRTVSFAIYATYLLVYLIIVLILDLVTNGRHKRFASSIFRIAIINAIILLFARRVVHNVKKTQFCKSIDSKTIYSRPFLPKTISNRKKESTSTFGAKVEPIRLTTTPWKTDVLLGNRYDSKFIGNYMNFLNFHPGNRALKQHVKSISKLYHSYNDLPPLFQNEIVANIEVDSDRFLSQNDFGEWTVMTSEERRNEIIKMLSFDASSKRLFPALDKKISILLASAKFGTTLRNSKVMKRITQLILFYWRDEVLGKALGLSNSGLYTTRNMTSSTTNVNGARFDLSSLFKMNSCGSRKDIVRRNNERADFVGSFNKKHIYKVGDKILYNFQGSGFFVDGTIVFLDLGNYALVERSFEDGLTERTGVYLQKVKPFVPLTEGDKVAFISRDCPTCPNEYIPGVITHVYPALEYDVEYATNDIDHRLIGDFLARDLGLSAQ